MRGDLGLFLFALALRLILTAAYLHGRVVQSGLELGEVADNLLAGRGFLFHFYGTDVPRYAFFPPLYPAFLAGLKAVFGAHWIAAMQTVQALVSAGIPVLLRRLATRLLEGSPGEAGPGRGGIPGDPRRLAYLAGYAVALWPPLIVYSASAYSLTFDAFGATAVVLLLARTGAAGRLRDAAGAGAAYGLLALSLPAFLGSLPFVPFGLKAMGLSWRRAFGAAILAGTVALAVLSPWMARNARVIHRFVPVATNIGFNYLGGQNAYSLPWVNRLCPEDAIRWAVIDRHDLETMNEADFDRSLLRQGLDFALHHPGLTLRRDAVRLLYYWWATPGMVRYNPAEGLGYLVLMTGVLPFFLAGVAWGLRHRAMLGLLLAVFAWQSLFYMNFAVRGRYALTFHPLMLLAAVLGAAALLGRVRKRRDRAPAA